MAVSVEWTGYGRSAALALRDAVATAKAGEPLAPVTVVVPSNHVGVAARRLLASGSLGAVTGSGVGLAAVTFLTTYRLAELLGASDRKSTRLNSVTNAQLVCRLLLEKKKQKTRHNNL